MKSGVTAADQARNAKLARNNGRMASSAAAVGYHSTGAFENLCSIENDETAVYKQKDPALGRLARRPKLFV